VPVDSTVTAMLVAPSTTWLWVVSALSVLLSVLSIVCALLMVWLVVGSERSWIQRSARGGCSVTAYPRQAATGAGEGRMMDGFWILDVLLVLLLVGYTVSGYRRGLLHGVSALAGVVVGAVAAYFAIPIVGSWVPEPMWRIVATVFAAITLVVLGHSVGASVGRSIRSRLKKSPLRMLDRVLGAVVSGIAAALIVALLALGVTSLGVPPLSQAIGASAVLRAVNDATPDPVEAFLARVRSTVVDDGLPLITEALGGITTSPELPLADTGTPDLVRAANSVVRITGNAFECGQNQTGSGFVVARDRVVTNAHVVAGVAEPIVELPGGGALPGRIVYFDPTVDLAVIAVAGMTTPPLPLASTLPTGASAVVDGYPYGGPFTTGAAKVLSITTTSVDDIYGQPGGTREIYTLAADVREGNSGGPLVTTSGEVAGVVFAKSADLANVGYAMTIAELGPVAAAAPTLSEPVAPGTCVRG
jgi:S1-C subfamily serine protease